MTTSIPIEDQQRWWNHWNGTTRETELGEVSRRQGEVVRQWLADLGSTDLDLLEVGCGAGWLCPDLARFGRVTGTDLSDEVLARAQVRSPDVRYVAGDFMMLDLGRAAFDVVVCLEVLSHIADQPGFVAKMAGHLRPGGHLMLATQNRPVLERYNRIPPPGPGQLRHWVDRDELTALLAPHFEIHSLRTVTPLANRGAMRVVNSHKLNKAIGMLVGDRFEQFKERAGLGWTIMALAHRRGGAEN
jgi:2-polyprenyl-3-methyl-5-hydroxy-6-metoxy-1,4-benzoquinol methylase